MKIYIAQQADLPPFGGLVGRLLDLSMFSKNKEHEIRFKRCDMTDEEFENLPED